MTRHGGLRCTLLSILAVALSACATVPDDASVVEKLDDETGLTVARLGRAIEVYRETFLKEPSGRFAFMGPFETNQMGTRELFVWVAVPIELGEQDTSPIVTVNGKELALGTPGRTPDFAGLRKSPYKISTPWSSMYYYRVDESLIGALGEARTISVRVTEPTRDGTVKTVFAVTLEGSDARLRDFAAR
ncbi:MAG: hypothetical protein H7Y89_19075 [Steroidobacteraceae bacterium]|nr:hypothetical protein [Steroidobacteraceae bacterium]